MMGGGLTDLSSYQEAWDLCRFEGVNMWKILCCVLLSAILITPFGFQRVACVLCWYESVTS